MSFGSEVGEEREDPGYLLESVLGAATCLGAPYERGPVARLAVWSSVTAVATQSQ